MGEPAKLTALDIQERLKPTHLIPNTQAELRAEVEKSASPTEPMAIALKDPRGEREWSFTINWEDGIGKIWKGEFTNKILSIRERSLVGITRARLAGGLATESIDALTEEINLITAHLMFSLVKFPDWAKDIQTLDSIELLQVIYAEVASHEAFFRGWRPSESESKG